MVEIVLILKKGELNFKINIMLNNYLYLLQETNLAIKWKKRTNFKQLSYQEFINKFTTIPKSIMMEKIDGILGILVYDKKINSIYFQLTGDSKIKDLPVLKEYKERFKSLNINNIILAGELCAMRNNIILPFNKTLSIVKTAYKIPSYKKLVHHFLFDVISINNQTLTKQQSYQFIKKFKSGQYIHKPEIKMGNLDTFKQMFKQSTKKNNIEGIVIFNLKGHNYKIKKQNTVDLCIIGGGEINKKLWMKKQISYLLTAFIDKQGIYRTSAKVGMGFSFSQREYFYKYLLKNQIYKNDKEVFVKPKLVIEVKYFRVMLTNTTAYKFKNNQYINIGKKESIQFSPVFMRIRKDKQANKNDCRLEQIPQWHT